MRTISSLTLLAAVWLTAVPASAARQFEGTVTFRNITVQRAALAERDFDLSDAIFDVATDRILALRDELEADGTMEVQEAQIVMKGSRLRFDAPGDEYAIMDFETGVMQLVRPQQQMYIEMTEEDRERMQAMSGMAAGETEIPDVRPTGEQRSMHGMRCTMYALTTEDGPARVCTSTDDAGLVRSFQAFAKWAMTMSEGDAAEPVFVVAEHGFPLIELSLDDRAYRIGELVEIDRSPVPDDRFEPPPGYDKMTLADIMRGGGQ